MTRLTTHMSGRRSLAEGEKTVNITILVPESLREKWKARAKAEKISLAAMIRRAMEGVGK